MHFASMKMKTKTKTKTELKSLISWHKKQFYHLIIAGKSLSTYLLSSFLQWNLVAAAWRRDFNWSDWETGKIKEITITNANIERTLNKPKFTMHETSWDNDKKAQINIAAFFVPKMHATQLKHDIQKTFNIDEKRGKRENACI